MENGVVMRFDVQKKNEGLPIRVSFHDTEYSDKYCGGDSKFSATGVVIKSDLIPQKNKWYTVEIRAEKTPGAQNKDNVEVYIFDKESGIGTELSGVITDGISMMSRSKNNNGKIWVGPVGSDSEYIPSGYNYWDTEYLFDNFLVYNRAAKSSEGIWFQRDNQTSGGSSYTSDMTSLGIPGVMEHSLAVDGTNVYRNLKYVSAEKENFFLNYQSEQPLPCDNFVFKVDVMKKSESGSIQFDIGSHGNSSLNKIGISYMIPAKQLEVNKWYTYMMVKQGTEICAYRKERDKSEFVDAGVIDFRGGGADFDRWDSENLVIILAPYRETNWSDSLFVAIMKNQYAAYGADDDKIGLNSAGGSEYGVDNIEISELNAVTLLMVPEPQGILIRTEVDVSDKDIKLLMPIIGVFDENGRYTKSFFEETEVLNFKGSVDYVFKTDNDVCSAVESNGKAEAFIWSATTNIPLTKKLDISDWFKQ